MGPGNKCRDDSLCIATAVRDYGDLLDRFAREEIDKGFPL
jgi:hypothetical protein